MESGLQTEEKGHFKNSQVVSLFKHLAHTTQVIPPHRCIHWGLGKPVPHGVLNKWNRDLGRKQRETRAHGVRCWLLGDDTPFPRRLPPPQKQPDHPHLDKNHSLSRSRSCRSSQHQRWFSLCIFLCLLVAGRQRHLGPKMWPSS